MSPQRLQIDPFPVVPAPAHGMATGDWAWLGMLSLLWGSGTFFNEVAVQGMAPITVVFCRVALAAIVVGLVVRRRGVGLLPGRKEVVPFLVLGVVNTVVPYSLIAWGAQRLDSGVAGILLATTPMFTVLIAHVATGDERLGIATMTGIGLGLAGVLLILGGHPLALAGDIAIPMLLAVSDNDNVVSPEQLDGRRIGHHGFFRQANADLWDELIEPWLAG